MDELHLSHTVDYNRKRVLKNKKCVDSHLLIMKLFSINLLYKWISITIFNIKFVSKLSDKYFCYKLHYATELHCS